MDLIVEESGSRILAKREKIVHRALALKFICNGNNLANMELNQNPLLNISKQKDGFNCCILIIYYAFTIMSDSSFDKNFDPNEYRNFLKSFFIKEF